MRVLLIEDDPEIARRIQAGLTEAGFVVDHAFDGQDGLTMGLTEDYAIAVLDLGLPQIDGIEVLKRWRSAGLKLPIIILSARGTWVEKVEGLNAGADDYVTKPFHIPEIIARLQALLRRHAGTASQLLQQGDIVLDVNAARVTKAGQIVALTSFEFRMLKYLLLRSGRIVTQSDLAAHLYAQEAEKESNTIEVYVSRLRRKLGSDVIKTVRGFGYRLG